MPRATAAPLRQRLQELLAQRLAVPDIAQVLRLPARTVRRLAGALRQGGPEGLLPDYGRCGRPAGDYQPALQLRQQRPGWGAPYLRVILAEEQPDRPWPSARTLQRHLKRAGLQPAPPGRRPRGGRPRASRPHQRWQIDAVERVPLRTGQQVCWLSFDDEHTGAFLRSVVFPPR